MKAVNKVVEGRLQNAIQFFFVILGISLLEAFFKKCTLLWTWYIFLFISYWLHFSYAFFAANEIQIFHTMTFIHNVIEYSNISSSFSHIIAMQWYVVSSLSSKAKSRKFILLERKFIDWTNCYNIAHWQKQSFCSVMGLHFKFHVGIKYLIGQCVWWTTTRMMIAQTHFIFKVQSF